MRCGGGNLAANFPFLIPVDIVGYICIDNGGLLAHYKKTKYQKFEKIFLRCNLFQDHNRKTARSVLPIEIEPERRNRANYPVSCTNQIV